MRFAIVTRGRTGSNLLFSLLDSHPKIRLCGEIFGESQMRQQKIRAKIIKEGALPYLKRRMRRRGMEAAAGIKVLYYQLEEEYSNKWGVRDLPSVWEFLRTSKDFKIIHLKRRNKLRTLVSIKIAAATKVYVICDEKDRVNGVGVALTVEECEDEFNRIRQWEDKYDEALRDHDMLEIYYEDLAQKTDGVCQQVLGFLGVEQRYLKTKLVKQNVRPLPRAIKNFHELKEHFSGSPWEGYFEL